MSHTCHATGCNENVPPKLLMCPRHWRMVPKLTQQQVWRFYRPGQEQDKRPSLQYVAAAQLAIDQVFEKEKLKQKGQNAQLF